MSRKTQLLVIALTVLAITSVVSHLVARRLGLRTEAVTPLLFGATNRPVNATAAGSSLTFFGIAWSEVARTLETQVRGWAVPAGSVLEMELLQREAPPPAYTFLGVSAFDLNENYLSEFRADIIPLPEAVSELRAAGVDWGFAKRVLSQYPLRYLRMIFPTAGRSAAVMVGIREELRALRPRNFPAQPSERAVVASDSNGHAESIKDWAEARRLRQIGEMRGRASGTFEFNGPKRDALVRFLRRSAAQGRTIIVVMPESPFYREAFVTADVQRRFEALLAEAQRRVPEAVWVRLDTVPELQAKEYYWDLIHLNAPGQALATQRLLAQLAAAKIAR